MQLAVYMAQEFSTIPTNYPVHEEIFTCVDAYTICFLQ